MIAIPNPADDNFALDDAAPVLDDDALAEPLAEPLVELLDAEPVCVPLTVGVADVAG